MFGEAMGIENVEELGDMAPGIDPELLCRVSASHCRQFESGSLRIGVFDPLFTHGLVLGRDISIFVFLFFALCEMHGVGRYTKALHDSCSE